MTTCPGCGEKKSAKAALCANCRVTANALGVSVLTAVATPAQPFVPRTPKQNSILHGRLREIAQLEKPGIERGELWSAERKLKKWLLPRAAKIAGREITSTTELSEIEMERLLEWLADVVDAVGDGQRRPRR